MSKIIGFSGKIKSGKDTAATYLVDLFYSNHINTCTISFGDALKEYVAALHNLDIRLLYSQEGKNTIIPGYIKYKLQSGDNFNFEIIPDNKSKILANTYQVTIRDALIYHGNKLRNLNSNIWINYVKNRIDFSDLAENDIIIIPDVRYKNEAKFVKDNNGILIRLNRNASPKINNSSETDLDHYKDFDYIIDNNYTLDDLYAKIRLIFNKLKDDFKQYFR